MAAAVVLSGATARALPPLQSYSVDPSTVTIAGISSGGFMAVQMHVAFSSRIHGAAVFAGGPYYCEQDTTNVDCNTGVGLSLPAYLAYTAAQEDAGTIDPTSNLAGQPVYLFSGTNDSIIAPAVVNVLDQYYEVYDDGGVTYDDTVPAQHSWVSPDGTNSCDQLAAPYINNCNIDPEQTFLTMFYGALNPKNSGTLGGSFVQFSQAPYCAGGSCSALSMDSSGWLYVPQSCAAGQPCKLIVVLHGCLSGQDLIGEDLVKESGVDEWADTNGILVLYPQIVISANNLAGCWDMSGYTGANYALQSGAQMQTLMAMIDQILGQGTSSSGSSTGGSSGASSTGSSSMSGSSSSGTTQTSTSTKTATSTPNGTSTPRAATGSSTSGGHTASTGATTSLGVTALPTDRGCGCGPGSGSPAWIALLALAGGLRKRKARSQ
jgi:MYXO-CTERM domain-containing protein